MSSRDLRPLAAARWNLLRRCGARTISKSARPTQASWDGAEVW